MVFERKILRKIFGPTYENGSWRIKSNQELDNLIKRKNTINFPIVQRLGWYGYMKECKKQEWSKQYTPGNPFQRGQWGDQRYAGRMMLKKYIQWLKVPNWRLSSRIEEDGRKWLGRPKLCTKSCRAILSGRIRWWMLLDARRSPTKFCSR